MKKTIYLLMVGILLIGSTAFAAGDLIVNGKLSVGSGTTPTGAFSSDLTKSTTTFLNANIFSATDSSTNSQGFTGMAINPWHTGSGDLTNRNFLGATYNFQLQGQGSNINWYGAQSNSLWMKGTGNYSIGTAFGSMARLQSSTAVTNTLTNYYGYWSTNIYQAGTNNGATWAGFYADDFTGWVGTVGKVSGLWIQKQTFGTKNYGIALNGTGTGADIAFGNIGVVGQDARIYFDGSEIRAVDAAGNDTAISPHDPETGEWVFYSKNIKTGRTVKINMEKLVKAVEKLTGETFMVETLMEEDK